MHYQSSHISIRGFSFIEMLVTAAIAALVFGGLMASLQFTLKLISVSKAKIGATSLTNERLEYIRSLSYDDVGTSGGIPDGALPQTSTSSINGVLYHERILVQYVDAPEDGLGGSDTNGILADYKEVKIEYSWEGTNGTSTIFLLTNVVPPGIESTAGGGTLTVNVFDAGVNPVLGAEVHIYNNTTTTTIDTVRYTNVDGIAMFAGAPAAANYEITVSKTGYSTDQTYAATTSTPSPLTPHVAVIESAVSTMNFQIDELSDLTVRTIGPSVDGLFTDSFADATYISMSADIDVVAGEAVLAGGAGTYGASGSLLSVSTTPMSITSWDTVNWNSVVPASTTLMVYVYSVTGTSTYTLIPDTDLIGNSAGFTSGSLNISGLDVDTYPTLALGALLTSSDSTVTPALDDWEIQYIVSEPSIGSIPFTLTSNKIIDSTPIYKYQDSHTTNGSGEITIPDLEWDSYNLTLDTGAYDISEACSALPYILNPGVSETLRLTLVPASLYSLRVHTVDIQGDPIQDVTVTLSRSGVNEVLTTSSCGQVFFNAGLPPESDYVIETSVPGYVDQTVSGVSIDGADALTVTLIES